MEVKSWKHTLDLSNPNAHHPKQDYTLKYTRDPISHTSASAQPHPAGRPARGQSAFFALVLFACRSAACAAEGASARRPCTRPAVPSAPAPHQGESGAACGAIHVRNFPHGIDGTSCSPRWVRVSVSCSQNNPKQNRWAFEFH